jgi:HEAT repeat protein
MKRVSEPHLPMKGLLSCGYARPLLALTALLVAVLFVRLSGLAGDRWDASPLDAESLVERLESPDPLVAVRAAEAIEARGTADKELVEALAVAIKHPNEMVLTTETEVT